MMADSLENSHKPKRKSYWSDLVRHYEEKNASLEKRHEALAERVKIMELALPSMLMGAVVNSNPLPSETETMRRILNPSISKDTTKYSSSSGSSEEAEKHGGVPKE